MCEDENIAIKCTFIAGSKHTEKYEVLVCNYKTESTAYCSQLVTTSSVDSKLFLLISTYFDYRDKFHYCFQAQSLELDAAESE